MHDGARCFLVCVVDYRCENDEQESTDPCVILQILLIRLVFGRQDLKTLEISSKLPELYSNILVIGYPMVRKRNRAIALV